MGEPTEEQPRPQDELERLAQVGAQRRGSLEKAAAIDRQRAGYQHLRIAIGDYRGSTLRRTVIALAAILAVVVSVLAILTLGEAAMAVALIAVTVVGTVMVVLPPVASEGAIAAEARWVASLPFPLEGYFEVLAGEPEVSRTLAYEIVWDGELSPATKLLEDVVAAVDPKASVDRATLSGVRITSGAISGLTSLKRSKTSFVTRNHNIPPGVHAMVEQVLLSIHRRYPIARVTLSSR
jgi:hypothetical protein